MAFSEHETAHVRKALDAFMAARRPPAHIRPQLDLGSRINGQSVEIFEIRPEWDGPPGEKTEHPVAKTTFVRSRGVWRVFWSLLKSDKELILYLRELAPKPKLPAPTPELVAPPRSQNYGLIGTAFDYLLRWWLEFENADAQIRRWVSEAALQRLPPSHRGAGERLLEQAKERHAEFIVHGELTDDLIRAAVGLAQLDTVFRSGSGLDGVYSEVSPYDVEDLRALWEAVPPDLLRAQRRCILNPTFGVASVAVGGADADFILDDMLVDLKTIKTFELERRAFDQLLGYVLLARIGGIDSAGRRSETIRRVAIYFARHGTLVQWPLASIVSDQATELAVEWFRAHLSVPAAVDLVAVRRRSKNRARKKR